MLNFSFWILLAANIVLFVFQQSYFMLPSQEKREPERLIFQYHADKIRLLSVDEIKKIETPEKTTGSTSQTMPTCLEIGNFDSPDAARFEKKLAELSIPDENIIRVPVHENARHLVYIPPLANKKTTERKIAELQKNNVKNYLIQDQSKLHGAISLGIFKTDDAAKEYIAELNKQGIHDAQIGTRDVSIEKTLFQLSHFENDLSKKIDTILLDFPKQKKQECKPT